MNKIRLQNLALSNFKGMSFALGIGGFNADVMGANATGKTTLADAWAWLLFDKDSQGRSDFEIKNINAIGEAEHGLDHSVEGILEIDNSSTTLKKVYREIWKKQRGSATAVFSGNTTDYYIDGVPVQKKEYVARVTDLAGDEAAFRLLTSPIAFASLPWQKQRALLLDVCGDITDEDVVAADPSLRELPTILGKRTLDEYKRVVVARRTEINKEMTALPIRINEVTLGLPDISGLNRKLIEGTILGLEEFLSKEKLKLSGIDNGSNITELSKKLAMINADINVAEQFHRNEAMNGRARLSSQISDITESKASAERRTRSLSSEIAGKQHKVETIEGHLAKLRERWGFVNALGFKDTTEDTCAACGQSLPSDRVEEAREKALAQFNNDKATKLAEIENHGKAQASERDHTEEEIANLHAQIMDTCPAFDPANLEALTAQLEELRKASEDYTGIAGRSELIAQRVATEAAIRDAKEAVSFDRDLISGKVAELEAELKEAKLRADIFPRREQGEKRIAELMASEKLLATEFERMEKELYLCEQFIKTKVSLLTDRINSKFEIARFKLFEVQVNGGLAECCEITVNGIGYNSNLNNAAKINAGLDVCRTLARHYGLVAPIFVDNAESVCELISMEAQVIRLVVSEKDAVLRVELAS